MPNRLIHHNENTYYVISVIISILIYLSLIFSLIGILYSLAAALVSFILHDVFVIESGGMLNAFATRLLGRNFVVLYSDVFDLIESNADEELALAQPYTFFSPSIAVENT